VANFCGFSNRACVSIKPVIYYCLKLQKKIEDLKTRFIIIIIN